MWNRKPLQSKKLESLSIGEDCYEEHRQYLQGKLDLITEMKENAKISLAFLMDKFEGVFEEKKYFINEIERLEKEEQELKTILKI